MDKQQTILLRTQRHDGRFKRMSTLDKVYGNDMQTKCAWCLNKLATQEYVGLMAGMEYVLYQVCDRCYEDAPNKVEPTINDIKRMIEESEQADEATN